VAPNKGAEPDVSVYADFYSVHAICDKRFAMLHHEAESPAAMELYTLDQVGGRERREEGRRQGCPGEARAGLGSRKTVIKSA
jgi:hypothetical protein